MFNTKRKGIIMKSFQKLVACLFLMGLVTGCATRENMQLPQAFLAQPNSVLITQLSGLENPSYYQVGAQGLAEFAINRVIADDMHEKIQTIDAKAVVEDEYYKPYGMNFEDASFKVIKENAPINKETLVFFTAQDDGNYAPYDFRFLKAQRGVTHALILDPHSFGVIRPYYSLIPTGDPKGYAEVSIYLVNLTDNTIVGEYKANIQNTVQGEWDSPPDYLALIKASKAALARALSEARLFLFPMRAS